MPRVILPLLVACTAVPPSESWTPPLAPPPPDRPVVDASPPPPPPPAPEPEPAAARPPPAITPVALDPGAAREPLHVVSTVADLAPPRAILANAAGDELVVTPGTMLPQHGLVVLGIAADGVELAEITVDGHRAHLRTLTLPMPPRATVLPTDPAPEVVDPPPADP